MATKAIMTELSELLGEPRSIEVFTAPQVSAIIDYLKEVDMEVFDPTPRRTEQVDWKLKLFQQLNENTSSLDTEFSRGFGEDTGMLMGLLPFYHKDWHNMITHIHILILVRSLMKHAIFQSTMFSPQIDISNPTKLWQSFIKDEYTREMFPEHSLISTLVLILPLGSCTVERCFSYSSRICSDSRSTLTLLHISDLVRISQQGPDFPKSLKFRGLLVYRS